MSSNEDTDFRFLTENSVDIICRCGFGLDGLLYYVSPSCFDVLGWTPEELVGRTGRSLYYPEDHPLIVAAAAGHAEEGVRNASATVRIARKNGTLAWIEITARMVRHPETNEPKEVVLVMRDVGVRKALEDKLALLARTDGLTGLANRRTFDEALDLEWRRMLRGGAHLSLLMIDLDHFKEFNDHYGHQAGDDCLRAVAYAISQHVCRTTDTFARYGGEELVALLPLTDQMNAARMAKEICASVQALNIPNAGNPEGGCRVTISVGAATAVACHDGTMAIAQGLVLSADNALYRAKRAGRNQVMVSLVLAPEGSSVGILEQATVGIA